MYAAPKPIFVFFGIDGGATCAEFDKNRMFIGSQKGKVLVFGMDSKTLKETVYVDEEEQRIQSLSFSEEHIFVHVRGHAILKLRDPQNRNTCWNLLQSIEIDHIGFCNSLLLPSQMLIFASTDQQRIPQICWTDAQRSSCNKSSRITDQPDNTPMCMTSGEKPNEVIVGMEDGRLAVCQIESETFERPKMVELGKDPVFCVASCSKWIAAGCAKAPIYLLKQQDLIEVKEIQYPPESAGCSAITFSPNEKQILAGFWDGSIRVFSCLRLHVLLALSSTHTSSITSVTWRPPEEGELVIVTSSDSTISMWKLR